MRGVHHQTARRSAASVRASASGPRGGGGEATRSRRDALLLLGASTAAAVATEVPTIASAEPASPTTTTAPPTSAVARAPAAALTPRERDAVAAYELASPAVVNVFDLFLVRGGGVAFGSGAAEPEGNGSGVLWRDPATGSLVIVTNYHVLASSLDRVKEDIGGARSPGPTVARVVAQTIAGKRRALDAAVAGVDRSHDLAVLVLLGGAAEASSLASDGGGGGFFSELRPIERSETASTLRVGQQVFALGNPFGFELTFTGGLVSGTNRSFESKVSLVPSSSAAAADKGKNPAGPAVISGAIQHSAPINPGSSGGPLLDSRGRLVGLSTAIYTVRIFTFFKVFFREGRERKTGGRWRWKGKTHSPPPRFFPSPLSSPLSNDQQDTGSSVGLGFALPVDLLERIVPQLVATGRATTLGAGVGLAAPAVAAALLPSARGSDSSSGSPSSSIPPGVMISSVVPGSGADRAGLLPVRRTLAGVAAGDVVAAVGGRATPDAGAFAAALEQISSSGSGSSSESLEVEFDVVRGVGTGQQRREKVAVSLAPE